MTPSFGWFVTVTLFSTLFSIVFWSALVYVFYIGYRHLTHREITRAHKILLLSSFGFMALYAAVHQLW